MRQLLAITNALADENRVRILACLEAGELCVCQIIELLGLAPSAVSKHLTLLRFAGLIDSRKQGRWMHYRIADRDAALSVRRAMAWLRASLLDDPRIAEDRRRLRAIRAIDPEKLCCMQRDGKPCCPPPRRTPRRATVAQGAGHV